jgi:peptidoglycan/xylan/chitin deacetylase (PgdA/CDA1 family)
MRAPPTDGIRVAGSRRARLWTGGAMSPRFRPIVLCYHAVTDSWPDPLAVGAETIERQVNSLLLRGYRPAAAAQALEAANRVVHVTFDDAYRTVERALPRLERLGVPATVFVCTAFADGGRPFALPRMLERAKGHEHELATMDWDALRRLARRGHEVGSHGVSHVDLTQLSETELERELRESKEHIESELRRPCRFIAYPYGADDARVHAAAREAGYVAGFTLAATPGPLDRYAIPRVDIYRRDGVVGATLKTSAARKPAAALARIVGRRA